MKSVEKYKVTQNACRLCSPLGASIAFKGIKGAINLIHGSQGCSTYIRRYLISHFREPIDIASSNFSEDTAIFGGQNNLKESLKNIILQYNPEVIGVSSTCLSETIGDDVVGIIKEFIRENRSLKLPEIISVSTPSYKGSHLDGYYESLKSIVRHLVIEKSVKKDKNLVNFFIHPLSCADINHFREILDDYSLKNIILPDYSETLNGGIWNEYHKIPPGGTDLKDLKKINEAQYTIEPGRILKSKVSAGSYLENNIGIKLFNPAIPIGVNECDDFFNILKIITGKDILPKYKKERDVLIDSYSDGHKIVFAKRVCIYGDEDFIASLALFLCEIGMLPELIITGSKNKGFCESIKKLLEPYKINNLMVVDDTDFIEMENYIKNLKPDLLMGNSKGFKSSKKFNIPLIRVGFPIHDRFGASRILHIGYRGTQRLFDEIINVFLEKKQEDSGVGYSYL